MKKSPLNLITERFENKEKLISAVRGLAKEDLWLDRLNPEKGLERVSNAKLLRLHALLTDAAQRFGSRASLIAQIQELKKRGKDPGYAHRLEGYPLPRLLDLHASLSRAAERLERAPKKTRVSQPQAKPPG